MQRTTCVLACTRISAESVVAHIHHIYQYKPYAALAAYNRPASKPPAATLNPAVCTDPAQVVFNATCMAKCPSDATRNTTTGVCGELYMTRWLQASVLCAAHGIMLAWKRMDAEAAVNTERPHADWLVSLGHRCSTAGFQPHGPTVYQQAHAIHRRCRSL